MEIRVMKINKSAVWKKGRHIVIMKIKPTLGTQWTPFIVGSPTYYLAVDLDVDTDEIIDFEKLYEEFVSKYEGLVTDEPLYLHQCNLLEVMKGTKYGDLKTMCEFIFYYADRGHDETRSQKELRKLVLQGIYDNTINRLYDYYIPEKQY